MRASEEELSFETEGVVVENEENVLSPKRPEKPSETLHHPQPPSGNLIEKNSGKTRRANLSENRNKRGMPCVSSSTAQVQS